MATAEKQRAALAAVTEQVEELQRIVWAVETDDDVTTAWERLNRWKERTALTLRTVVHPQESDRFAAKRKGVFYADEPVRNITDEAEMYLAFLASLREELERHPDHVLDRPLPAEPPKEPPPHEVKRGNAVFIVHGHDELNLLRLKDLLNTRFRLPVLVLAGKPGKGRTLIEKFEEEAESAAFAFVLLTPDDTVAAADGQYAQARPNVVFELGWFYGRLGRKNVTLLFKAGTKIHSDLDGVSRIEFQENVGEKIEEIERELVEAGLLQKR